LPILDFGFWIVGAIRYVRDWIESFGCLLPNIGVDQCLHFARAEEATAGEVGVGQRGGLGQGIGHALPAVLVVKVLNTSAG